MKNYIQPGGTIEHTNSEGSTIISGRGVVVGDRVGVAANDILDTKVGIVTMDGVFSLPKLSTDVVAQGVDLYWDDTNKRLTLTPTANTLAGYAQAAAGNGITSVECRLNR